MKFGQHYLSEKVALSFNVFAGYVCKILSIFRSQKCSVKALNFSAMMT